jgi:hypothetical protein
VTQLHFIGLIGHADAKRLDPVHEALADHYCGESYLGETGKSMNLPALFPLKC